ncbi:hypothetical protein Lumi_072 [Xylophilus phage Lumi]|nr:hypothetical protein Lumi_072 [Xylophilus phage Lumi]
MERKFPNLQQVKKGSPEAAYICQSTPWIKACHFKEDMSLELDPQKPLINIQIRLTEQFCREVFVAVHDHLPTWVNEVRVLPGGDMVMIHRDAKDRPNQFSVNPQAFVDGMSKCLTPGFEMYDHHRCQIFMAAVDCNPSAFGVSALNCVLQAIAFGVVRIPL